jgi:hypothetical protein
MGEEAMKRMSLVAVAALAFAVALPSSAPAATDVLRVTPRTVHFGMRPVGSFTLKSATVTNTSAEAVNLLVTVEREWDDFSFGLLPGSTCPVFEPEPLAPGDSCDVVVGFRPSEFFAGTKQDQVLLATATDPTTGETLESVQIAFIGTGRWQHSTN